MEQPKFTRPKRAQRSRLYWAGMVSGLGCGLVVATALYRRVPVASIRDLVFFTSIVIIILGERLALRIPSRRRRSGLRRYRKAE